MIQKSNKLRGLSELNDRESRNPPKEDKRKTNEDEEKEKVTYATQSKKYHDEVKKNMQTFVNDVNIYSRPNKNSERESSKGSNGSNRKKEPTYI